MRKLVRDSNTQTSDVNNKKLCWYFHFMTKFDQYLLKKVQHVLILSADSRLKVDYYH